MIYGKLMLTKPNVLLMDEPTNHMDMETIESLQIGLEHYAGTLIFVSHDREFVGGLATRVIELKPGGGMRRLQGHLRRVLEGAGHRALSAPHCASDRFRWCRTATCPGVPPRRSKTPGCRCRTAGMPTAAR